MHVFYTPDIATQCEMPEEEAGHCLRVLRLTVGDEVTLTDGKGNFYKMVSNTIGCNLTDKATCKECRINKFSLCPPEGCIVVSEIIRKFGQK